MQFSGAECCSVLLVPPLNQCLGLVACLSWPSYTTIIQSHVPCQHPSSKQKSFWFRYMGSESCICVTWTDEVMRMQIGNVLDMTEWVMHVGEGRRVCAYWSTEPHYFFCCRQILSNLLAKYFVTRIRGRIKVHFAIQRTVRGGFQVW